MAQYCATFLRPEMLHIYRQIKGLREFRPVVFCQKRECGERFPFKEVVAVERPATHTLRRFWQKQICNRPIQAYPSESRHFARKLREHGASLLHIYFGHIGVYWLPLMRAKGLPVVVSFHGADAMVDFDKPAYLSATREVLQLSDLVLVRSQSLAERLLAAGCDIGRMRIHRTGIPLNAYPFIDREAPRSGDWRFVQACRLIPKKGLSTSLRAFAEFARTFPEARFVVAGEGPELGRLKELAGKLSIQEKVEFPGFLTQDGLRGLYNSSHIFVHPSELAADGNQEGVPNSMLEAMATGLPVLATLHGGIPEAVREGGMLVKERDHRALTRAMLELTSDPERYKTMCVAAAQDVKSGFEQDAQIEVLESCYREAIAGWRR